MDLVPAKGRASSPQVLSRTSPQLIIQTIWRSLQCPPNSCRNPVIPADSGGFRRNELWQEGLLFSSFWCLIIPPEFGHSGIETRMFHGIHRNGTQRNPVVYLFSTCFLIICDMSQNLTTPSTTTTTTTAMPLSSKKIQDINLKTCKADLGVQHTSVALQYIGRIHGRSVLVHGLVVTIYIM